MIVRLPHQRLTVPGFRFAGVHCGLKAGAKRDLALVVSEVPAVAVGAFTTNRVVAAPVRIARERVRRGVVQVVLVNSGSANACTGRSGEETARALCRVAARQLGVAEELVVPSSTGRIGVPLPRAALRRGILAAARRLSPDGFHEALAGMMTTDAFPKFAAARVRLDGRLVTVAGMAKGAGMIAPRMHVVRPAHATLLSYVFSDARISLGALRHVLRRALAESFNSIIVDGDTSTNDTVLFLANGVAGNRVLTPRTRGFDGLARAVAEVMRHLAYLVVKDAEGGTKVVSITVRRARSAADAERVAESIARSPLCKAAFHGGNPYAGRIVCAAGYSGARFDPGRLEVYLNGACIFRRGHETGRRAIAARAARVARKAEFALTLDLHAGRAGARRMTSDLSPEYVRFNSAYRT